MPHKNISWTLQSFFFHSGAFKRNKSDLCVSGEFKTRMFSMAQFPASRDTRNFVFLHLKTISMHLLGCTWMAVYKVKQPLLVAICLSLCLRCTLWPDWRLIQWQNYFVLFYLSCTGDSLCCQEISCLIEATQPWLLTVGCKHPDLHGS